jgi:hypothetical protein
MKITIISLIIFLIILEIVLRKIKAKKQYRRDLQGKFSRDKKEVNNNTFYSYNDLKNDIENNRL